MTKCGWPQGTAPRDTQNTRQTGKNGPLSPKKKKRETILRRNQQFHQLPLQSPERQAAEGNREEPVDRRLAILGELLYVVRPLVYCTSLPRRAFALHGLTAGFPMGLVCAMYACGVRSWRAWIASLAVDIGSRAASSTAHKGAHPEINRRTAQAHPALFGFISGACVRAKVRACAVGVLSRAVALL